jgi:methyl-accepting chemotaxis protein
MKKKALSLSALRRKKFLINPRFQLTFIYYMTAISGIAITVLYLSNSYFFWRFQKMGVDLGIPQASAFFQFLAKQRVLMNHITVVTSIILLILILVVGILFSHRISGPIHRLETHMRKIADGTGHDHVRFRKSDYFPELAEAFNLAIDKVTRKKS